MYEEILQIVKEHLTNNPEVAATIPEEQADSVHREIADQIHTGIQNPAALLGEGGIASLMGEGGIASLMSGGPSSANPIVSNLVGNLVSKCGLSPEAGNAISAALPGLLQKVMSHEGVGNTFLGGLGGFSSGLGGLFK
jgi:hypothetical protein